VKTVEFLFRLLQWCSISSNFSFLLSNIVRLCVLFLLVIVSSILLWLTTSDYLLGTFRLFLYLHSRVKSLYLRWYTIQYNISGPVFHIKPLIFITFSWSNSLADFHEIFTFNTIVLFSRIIYLLGTFRLFLYLHSRVKSFPHHDISLYISYKTIYYQNILLKSFLIWFSWNFQHSYSYKIVTSRIYICSLQSQWKSHQVDDQVEQGYQYSSYTHRSKVFPSIPQVVYNTIQYKWSCISYFQHSYSYKIVTSRIYICA
jgi:hypothetical protein